MTDINIMECCLFFFSKTATNHSFAAKNLINTNPNKHDKFILREIIHDYKDELSSDIIYSVFRWIITCFDQKLVFSSVIVYLTSVLEGMLTKG